ncbi:MAG: transglutaminase family protein [Pseudomonas sp.]
MHYRIRLRLQYDYAEPVADGRHLLRVLPRRLDGVQEVEQAQVLLDPQPDEVRGFEDFFGNRVTALFVRAPHRALDIDMQAQVKVERGPAELDLSPDLAGLRAELAEQRTLAPDSPWHCLPASARVPALPRIAAYAASSLRATATVVAAVRHLNARLRGDFAYDPDATEVDTPVAQAFDMRRGVCQDFSHIMIAGLRGLGIPAGYVSGLLRTIPPPGKPRLEGADASHAWVRVWCGRQMGWQEFDPTNGIPAGDDHITLGHGRDYGDVAPMTGVLRTTGKQEAKQMVDVLPL